MRRGAALQQLIGRVVLAAIVGARGFRDDQEKIALAQRLMPLEPRYRHAEYREGRVRALIGRHV